MGASACLAPSIRAISRRSRRQAAVHAMSSSLRVLFGLPMHSDRPWYTMKIQLSIRITGSHELCPAYKEVRMPSFTAEQ